MSTPDTYRTTLGEELTLREVGARNLVICDECRRAVVEDDHIFCPKCDMPVCVYCWQEAQGECKCGANILL